MKRTILTLSLATMAAVAFAQDADEPAEVTAIRKRIPELKKALVDMRKLPFKREVAVEYQSDADFRSYMTGELDKEIPDEMAAELARFYHRIGYVKKGFKIKQAFVDMMASQALAYYNPNKDTFYMLKTDMPAMMLDPSVLHELHHAIQDQHFKLDGIIKKASELGEDDRVTAVKFLFEGEATYLMTVYAVQKQGLGEAMAATQINMMGSLDREAMSQMERAQLPLLGEAGKSMKTALDARDKLPRYLYRTLIDPYNKGASTILKVKAKGGWAAVDALFKNPPTSTEQVLHPEKLVGDRDEPVDVELPDLAKSFGEGWSRKQVNCFGELGLQTLFKDILGDMKADAAAGWGGDSIHAYENADNSKTAIVWSLTFDSVKDAREFASAYKALLFKKYSQEKTKVVEGVLSFAKDGEEHLMTLKDQDVLVIEGAPVGKARGIMAAALKGGLRGEAALAAKRARLAAKKASAKEDSAEKPGKKESTEREAH